MQQRRNAILTVIAVIAISVAWFWPFRNNFFIFDDFAMIEHVIAGPMAVLKGYNNILRVVSNVLLWPLFLVSDHNPLGYNLFSLSLYAINGVLFYFFCRKLFHDGGIASFAAIFFAASAIGCDAVFWKAAYSTPLNLVFYLLTLLTYLHFRQTGRERFYWLSVFLFALAVLSKEESASLPFILVAIELLVLKNRIDRALVKRLIPYCLLIVVYLGANYIIIYHVMQGQSELVKHSGFRPLHTLFAPWTVFFLPPQGRLTVTDSRIYLLAALLPAALVFVKDRRFFLFGLAWVFLTFLPQSLSTLSQFAPKYVFNSISRHLYIPSAGAAICYAIIMIRLRGLLPARVFTLLAIVVLAGYLTLNYQRIQLRGQQWGENDAVASRVFLKELKSIITDFPPHSYVYVIDGPTGRAYIQQSLRAFYMNPDITWIVDPSTFIPLPGMSVFWIYCEWYGTDKVVIKVQH